MKTKEGTDAVSDFDKLVSEIGDVHKALPDGDTDADDKKIEEAAGEGDGDNKDDDKGDGKDAMKSFEVTLADGTKQQAMDATDLLKSLSDRVDAAETDRDVLKSLISQTFDIVKSLQAQIAKLGGEGKGRKAVVTLHERPAAGGADVTKSETNEMSANDFLAKSLEAHKAGKITSIDVAMAETYINKGQPVPPDLVRKVLS